MFELVKKNLYTSTGLSVILRYGVYTTKLFWIKLNFVTLKFDRINEYTGDTFTKSHVGISYD